MSAGRSCPLSYRYSPAALCTPASVQTDVLYVVGGLYGNLPALETVIKMFAAERGCKHLIFNGDFNWFNIAPGAFERINHAVLAFDATRGNVETELRPRDAADGDVGCGCGYPHWVDDGVVARSNAIMQTLAATAAGFPALQQRLAQLPMWRRIDVGTTPVAIVHGDATSLAGWGFARECLQQAEHQTTVRGWFDAADVRVFASSHTCAPVFHALTDSAGRACLVANNGAAGMPNFAGTHEGLLTRIATSRYTAGPVRNSTQVDSVYIDALPIAYDSARWHAEFLQQWPSGSAAHESYWQRMTEGPADVCTADTTLFA